MSRDMIKNTLLKYSQLGKTDKASYHAYEHFYPEELQYLLSKDEKTLNILEVGTASGGSLRCWMEIYPTASFYALDININNIEEDVRNDRRLKTLTTSQNSPGVKTAFPGVVFDLVIDDASHISSDQIATFHMLKDRLSTGGKYIIEDVYPENSYPQEFLSNFRVVNITHIKNRGDDILFIYQSPSE
jgi:cephalosporin hydroxylase